MSKVSGESNEPSGFISCRRWKEPVDLGEKEEGGGGDEGLLVTDTQSALLWCDISLVSLRRLTANLSLVRLVSCQSCLGVKQEA